MAFIDYLAEIWRARELLFLFAWRDVIVRYKTTLLGFGWVLLRPLITTLFFFLFYRSIANVDSGELPYILFVLAAMPFWQLFAAAMATSSQALLFHRTLITRIYFPRILLPCGNLLSQGVDYLVGMTFLLLCDLFFGDWGEGNRLLLLPITFWALYLSLLIAAVTAALALMFEDFSQLYPYLLQLLFFVTPIGYPTTIIPLALRYLLALNPLVGLIDLYRYALFGTSPFPFAIVSTLGWSCFLSFVTFRLYLSIERRIEEFG